MHVEISWQMGIVVSISGTTVSIFSIERNELLKTFLLRFTVESSVTSGSNSKPAEGNIPEWSCNGPIENLLNNKRYTSIETEDVLSTKYIARRLVISDFGMIIVHMEGFAYVDALLEIENEDQLAMHHLLVAYTISGVRTSIITPFSPVTCLVCPDRGEVVIAGHRDGSVVFYQCQDLTVLHKITPSSYCSAISVVLPAIKTRSTKDISNPEDKTQGKKSIVKLDRTTDTTAIIAITVGPDKLAPAVVCFSTEAGNLFVKALPDFIRWEKNRAPSALAQLATVPLQAVKGTLIQAQNWTAETAGVFAQNARSLADDALSELKKVLFPPSIVG
jgi:hypothetical protein